MEYISVVAMVIIFFDTNILINDNKTISVEMKNKINNAIVEFERSGENVDSDTVTTGAHYLFKVDPDAEQLDQSISEIFHTVTAKLLYTMKRGRHDIEPEITFLNKIVSKSDVDD